MAIYQYSTVPMQLGFNFNPNECTQLYITFKQNSTVLEKSKADLKNELAEVFAEGDEYILPFAFTQSESAKFNTKDLIEVQASFVLNGMRDSTNKTGFRLIPVLKKEEI